jgi:hypothetical protein
MFQSRMSNWFHWHFLLQRVEWRYSVWEFVWAENYVYWGNSKDTGPAYGICSVSLLQFHSFLKCFFFDVKKENLYVRISCGVCPQFLLWNIITILLLKALYFLGVFTDLQNVTVSFFKSGSPRGTVQFPLDRFLWHLILGNFIKLSLGNQVLVQIGRKYQVLYIKT